MSDSDLLTALASQPPLQVKMVAYHDPVVTLAGDGWNLNVICPWHLVRDSNVVTTIDDPGAEDHLRRLVGNTITAVIAGSSGNLLRDPVFIFADGTRLEISSDTDLEPWVLKVQNKLFVGALSER
jgi:hypothetical protein